MKKVAADLSISKDVLPASSLLDSVCRFKEKLISPCEAINNARDKQELEKLAAKAYDKYQEKLEEERAMDFGDLVTKTVYLLQTHPGIRDKIGIEHLLVDEFQDTDYAQFTMIRLLLGPTKNITAVGDIDQAIYSFRGADHTIMCNFKYYFPNAIIQPLGKNYRCSGTIVKAASNVICHNKNRIENNLTTDNPNGDPVVFVTATDDLDESVKVAQQIKAVQDRLQIPLSQIAILYRTNIQSQQIEEQLLKYRIPYHVVGNRFFERREIVDIITYLRLIDNPEDAAAMNDFLNNPKKKLSAKSRAALEDTNRAEGKSIYELMRSPSLLAATTKEKTKMMVLSSLLDRLKSQSTKENLPEFLKNLLQETGIRGYYLEKENRESQARGISAIDNLSKLVTMVTTQYKGIAEEEIPELLHHANLMSDDAADGTDGVQLMTLHAAKGTEYRVVFLVGAEENIIPHWRALRDMVSVSTAIEEE
ncbi:MAG TPA: ATP-dependent helicase, partial [Methylomirabilota bacterium]|nr:ATP-dependent helicase [Methylomirabilota bacterium]